MKKMLYCMHIGWNWIKQRPHFLAEELNKYYDLTVISNHIYTQKMNSSSKIPENLKLKNFYKVPFTDRFEKLYFINNFWRRIYYSIIIKKIRPDYLYVMSPDVVKFLSFNNNVKIIYDCMDDMIHFTDDSKIQAEIIKNEEKLVLNSDIVITSSEHLKDVLISRYPVLSNKEISVVRNGFNGDVLDEFQDTFSDGNSLYSICYFGTIAEWFNFEFIIKSLDDIPGICYYLIGPVEDGCKIPDHERLKYLGVFKHEDLYSKIKNFDAFIMPFILTELIKSVDPVKLYEYINFNKNILCIRYPEIERFSDFVFFYDDYKSFIEQIKIMINMKEIKYEKHNREKFLSDSTWNQRGYQIRNLIDKLL